VMARNEKKGVEAGQPENGLCRLGCAETCCAGFQAASAA